MSAVTELVVAELMYLQWMDPKEPIYLYINSTGTTRDDGETVSFHIGACLMPLSPPTMYIHICILYMAIGAM